MKRFKLTGSEADKNSDEVRAGEHHSKLHTLLTNLLIPVPPTNSV